MNDSVIMKYTCKLMNDKLDLVTAPAPFPIKKAEADWISIKLKMIHKIYVKPPTT